MLEGVIDNDSGTNILYGAGLEFSPNDSFDIRAEWTRVTTDIVDDSDTDVDFLSVSGVYNF